MKVWVEYFPLELCGIVLNDKPKRGAFPRYPYLV